MKDFYEFLHKKKGTYLLLLVLALCYYTSYYRFGLYGGGEGGFAAMAALRIIHGQAPIKDVVIAYNILWFYPIVWLFKIVGPNYLALKIYFFAISTCSSLLAYTILWETTEMGWVSLLGGILVLILPGQLFRNYMGFIPLFCLYFGLKAYLLPTLTNNRRLLWMLLAAMTLCMTMLIRIDLGIFFSIIFLVLLGLYPWIYRHSKAPLLTSLLGLCILIIIMVGIHLLVDHWVAQHHFAKEWENEYARWPAMMITQLEKATQQIKTLPFSSWGSYKMISSTPSIHQLRRPPLIGHDMHSTLNAWCIYFPLLDIFIILFIAIAKIGSSLKEELLERSTPNKKRLSGWILLTSLAACSTTFSQYFFWRPDMVHLSESMVAMMPLILMAIVFLWSNNKKSPLSPSSTQKKYARLTIKTIATGVLSYSLILYISMGIQTQLTGAISVIEHRDHLFLGKNQCHVFLNQREWEENNSLYQLITEHTTPQDYVVCFPYNPEVNFYTNRDSFYRNFYVDDAVKPDNHQAILNELQEKEPAAVVVFDRRMNGTEESRFSVWAHDIYKYIQSHYKEIYQYNTTHLFVLSKKLETKKSQY